MDDHHPGGLNHPGSPNDFHPAPAPYGIPYRALYSKNIGNLWFAGRNISATHAAMSSTRVMATCAVIGQAVGTAAAVALRDGLTPRGVYLERLTELQNALREDDCWLPFTQRQVNPLTQSASLTSERPAQGLENLRNGCDRPIGEFDNGAYIDLGTYIELSWPEPKFVRELRIVFDSDLERDTVTGFEPLRKLPMLCNVPYRMEPFGFPQTLVKSFTVHVLTQNGWQAICEPTDNAQRLVRIPVGVDASALRLTFGSTWGAGQAHVFSLDAI